MKVSFEGAGEMQLSFFNDGAKAGQFVKMKDNGTVTACEAGDEFIGVCLHADSKHADVRVKGYVECAFSGTTAPTVGFCALSADADGKVKPDSSGAKYLVLNVDGTGKTVGFMM